MIFADVSLEKRITDANTVIVSRLSTDNIENPIVFRNGNSAVVSEFSKIDFEQWLKNPVLTFINVAKEKVDIEKIFASPVKSSIKVKMKIRINGTVSPIPIDSEDIVYLDE